MADFIKRLNRNRVFKFFSSLQLAVPSLLAMALAVSVGTILESRYNADYAKLLVYNATWFQALLVVLWINIFCATVSRIPFKRHHTGFVITHIGLLTLLIGSVITARWGIDGQLRIVEGKANNIVVLSDLVLEVFDVSTGQSQVFGIDRKARAQDESTYSEISRQMADRFKVLRYEPFVSAAPGYVSSAGDDGEAIQFRIKSPFFDVSQWLHSKEMPFLQQGPATFLLKKDVPPPARAKPAPKLVQESTLSILDLQSGQEIAKVPVKQLAQKPLKVKDVSIQLRQAFEEAIVGNGGMKEGGTPGKNPALLLSLERAGKAEREVVFANFAEFSLHPEGGIFGLKLVYLNAGGGAAPEQDPHAGLRTGAKGGGNRIEFSRLTSEGAHLSLSKAGENVAEKDIKIGEVFVTPWMGIEITVQKVLKSAISQSEVTAIEVPMRTDLPPSALKIQPVGGEPLWVVEESPVRFAVGEKAFEIYLGRRNFQLPFDVFLDKFSKVDYPGTQTPVSYESDVLVGQEKKTVKISMNEPYKQDGFTLYQSSYVMEPGQPVSSIFSVNHDPGRPAKYAGSIILCLGIIIYTLMKSRVYRSRKAATPAVS